MKVNFEMATIQDVQEITSVSIKAFHTDFKNAGRGSVGGPPGYDSVEFHKQMIKESSVFYKILAIDKIIGGFWFNKKNSKEAYLYRVFLDPRYHKKGLGLQTFQFIFTKFPDIEVWTLKVPNWNTRTPEFYQKIGFKIEERSDRFLHFKYNRNL